MLFKFCRITFHVFHNKNCLTPAPPNAFQHCFVFPFKKGFLLI